MNETEPTVSSILPEQKDAFFNALPEVATLPKDAQVKVITAKTKATRKDYRTPRELYAAVQRAARTSRSTTRGLNALRQLDAGQKMRHREVLNRDQALTFIAQTKGSLTPVDPENVKYAESVVEQAHRQLAKLPLGDRRTRRFAAREAERAQRLLTKTEYRAAQ